MIATLVAFRSDKLAVPDDPASPHEGGNFIRIVEHCAVKQGKVIDDNNGIKRPNVSELLLPLGVLPADLPEALLILLDQTGKKRGDMVHKSSRVSLRTVRDPFADEISDIDHLVGEIGSFDQVLEQLGLLSH